MKTIRFLTVMLTALSMGAAFAHLLEMPAKLRYDGPTWLHLLQTLYPPGFGTVGAACEVLAVVASLMLVVATRNRRKAFPWTLLGFSCVLASHAIFWIWVNPVNMTMVPLTPDTLVMDWTRLRDQWEFAHASRAILQIVALGAFVLSLLAEIPKADLPSFDKPCHDPTRGHA
jgi:hypothetical protein